MPEKQFVKAKPLFPKDKGPGAKESREPRKNKKYEEKEKPEQKDPREGIKYMLATFKEVKKSVKSLELANKYPKIFDRKFTYPEKDGDFSFNDYLKLGLKKQFKSVIKQLSSDEDEPEWDSDCEKQVTLESKKIDETIINKVQEQFKNRPIKKIGELQRHEKQFIEDYYRQKKNQQFPSLSTQYHGNQNKQNEQNHVQPSSIVDEWNQYKPKVDELITGGHLKKIQNGDDDEEDFDVDDFQWDRVEQSKKLDSEQNSDSSDGDDVFADDQPRTILEKKQACENSDEQGIVFINTHFFTKVAEKVGVSSVTCIWIISNRVDRYKVGTEFMNSMYRQKQLYKAFPYISLNHSQFIKNDQIQSDKALDKLKASHDQKRAYKANRKQYQTKREKKQYFYNPKQ